MSTKMNVTLEIAANNAASFVLDKVRNDAASLGQTVTQMGNTPGPGRLDRMLRGLSLTSASGVGEIKRLTSSMAFMGLAAVGAAGPVGKLGESLLLFGGGHVAVLLVATALLGAGLAMKALKGRTEETNKEFDELIQKIHKAYIEGQPEAVKFAATQEKLTDAVKAADAAIARATDEIETYTRILASAEERAGDLAAVGEQLADAEDRVTAAQDRKNKVLHALGELRGEQRKTALAMIADLEIEAKSVGKTAGEMLRLKMEAQGMNKALIDQAVHWRNLIDAKEAAISRAAAQAKTDVDLQVMRAREVERQRRASLEPGGSLGLRVPHVQDISPVEDQPISGPSEGGGETGIKRIAMGFLEAADNAQTLNQIIADMATNTLNALADAFTNAFEAAFSGAKSAGEAFAGAMLNGIKAVAKQSGMLALADAARALAHGIMGNPAGFASAAKHAAAAAMYFAVAGGAGALAGGGSGGAGGGGLSSSSIAQQDVAAKKEPLTLVFKGDINYLAPEFVDGIARAIGDGYGRNVIVMRES